MLLGLKELRACRVSQETTAPQGLRGGRVSLVMTAFKVQLVQSETLERLVPSARVVATEPMAKYGQRGRRGRLVRTVLTELRAHKAPQGQPELLEQTRPFRR